jgi:glycerate kinase
VTNPLLGKNGTARVFGPQKGATPAMVRQLEKNLRHYANVVGYDPSFAGAGAAGGLGFGLRAFFDAETQSGAEIVMRYGGFNERLRHADLVITGEGKLDAQTLGGKAPLMVAQRAKKFGLPVLALAGSVAASNTVLRKQGIDVATAIRTEAMSLDYAVKHAARLLEEATAKAVINFLR